MPAVKIQKFLGAAPKLAPEQLPDSAAQTASNIKLYSGDLLPFHYSTTSYSAFQSGVIKSIYPLEDPDTGTLSWLSWLTDVDVAVVTTSGDDEQRIYYTGDGAPKVTNYDLAIQGGGPFPFDAFDLGLPLPTAKPSASATSYTTKTISSYARDAGNIATIVTSTAHGLKSGAVVTVSGFNDASPDTTPFNVTNTTVTVVNTTTLSYYNSGPTVTTTSTDTDGRLSLAGGTILRSYVYTWMTPWGEESVPSDPSDPIYIKEGQVVTVSNLPNTPPAGNNFIRGIRIYRTVTSSSGADYLRLRTAWFPVNAAAASRTSNVATVVFSDYHNLLEGDRFQITSMAFGGVGDTSFNVTDGTVLSVVDNFTFTYASVGANKAPTATSAGVLNSDVSEPGSTSGVYYTGTTFTDNFDVNGLLYPLESIDYDAPDADMQGIVTAHNNILAGFVDNEVCFSEPGKPWAWPLRYRKIFPDRIVGIAATSGYILVMTDRFPYIIEGQTPDIMQYSRLDTPYPCTSKRGIVNMPYGVAYPTYGGLASFGVNGVELITKALQDWDTWVASINVNSITAEFYNGKYFASDNDKSFVFERDDQNGGTYVTSPIVFSAAYYHAKSGQFYYVADILGNILKWDDPAQPLLSLEWKSKKIVTQEYINIGAARVVADYSVDTDAIQAIIEYNANVLAYNTDIWALVPQMGTFNSGVSYVDPLSAATVQLSGAWNTHLFNGDIVMRYELPIPVGSYPVGFRLWADGNLMADITLVDSEIFRLPTGYRSDTFEVAVSGSARVQAIHLGETPYGLRTA